MSLEFNPDDNFKINNILTAYSASTERGFRKHLNSHSGYI